MTKSQELQILRETIAKLGQNSYCGAWLADQLPSIESSITSDYPPETYALSIHEARIHCEKIISQAKDESAAIEKRAKADAEKLRETACKFNESIREDLKRSIESALQRIERY
jgi:plasmid stabilization system protein ParE